MSKAILPEPILVDRVGDRYIIIVGIARYLSAKELGSPIRCCVRGENKVLLINHDQIDLPEEAKGVEIPLTKIMGHIIGRLS